MADCSKGGIRPPEKHDRRQWTAEYVGSLAAWMTTTGDGGGWMESATSKHGLSDRECHLNFNSLTVS